MAAWIAILILALIGAIACVASAAGAADGRIGHGGAALIGAAVAVLAFTNL